MTSPATGGGGPAQSVQRNRPFSRRLRNEPLAERLLFKFGTATVLWVPELTRSAGIQLNKRVLLRCRTEAIWSAQGHCLYVRVITQSRRAIILRLAAFHSRGKMKSPRRRPIQKAKTPKDVADQFREWWELRIKVSRAELAAQNKTADVEANGRSPRKPTGRSRTH
jgi:hypothetical protein